MYAPIFLRGARHMKKLAFVLGILLLQLSCSLGKQEKSVYFRARTPPRGWNSYDSFSWIVSEEEFLQNAEIVSKKLKQYGYEYVVVDFLWYRKIETGSSQSSPGYDVIDKWGRPIPDPNRWPSSMGGKGFKPIADLVHKMGLKFGIHVMRGISAQAVNANTPILGAKGRPYVEQGKVWHAKDIGLEEEPCAWMPKCFMSVNTKLGAGKAFLRSLYEQYAEWGVDFVKHDCVFGEDLNADEIRIVSEILKDIGRPIVYSLSPGSKAIVEMAEKISPLVNMYRVTGDDWDNFNALYLHFNITREFWDARTNSRTLGNRGLLGRSWPDLDMLPFGWITDPGVKQGPHRFSKLTFDEQKSQMTLWAMAKSPLFLGGDLRHIDAKTLGIITNPLLLRINSYSFNNSWYKSIHYNDAIKPNKNDFKNGKMGDSTLLLSVSSCQKVKMNNPIFTTNGLNQICWNGYSSRKDTLQVCFNRKTPFPSSMVSGQFRVMASSKTHVCLDSSPSSLSNFGEVKSYYFSRCTKHRGQGSMWMLRHDGSLYNNYTGLCASFSDIQGEAMANEVVIWRAWGLRGELYIAFFNLTPRLVTIGLYDIEKVLQSSGMSKNKNIVYLHEVWSGINIRITKKSRGISIPTHGSIVIVHK